MIRITSLLLSACLPCCALTAVAQSFQPKTIQFQGVPEYSNADLIAAANLKEGATFTAAEMNSHAQLLMDSGLFNKIGYNFNGQDLIFRIAPATEIYPMQLDNLPLTAGKELDARLHAHLPLYHGKLPLEGGLTDSVSKELVAELAAKGIQATLTAGPSRDTEGKVIAVNYTITSPPVLVGEMHLTGTSADHASDARQAAARVVGSSYSAAGSVSQVETALVSYYREQGYLDVTAHASAQPFTVNGGDIRVPFAVAVEEGARYKLGAVHLAPDLVVTQAAFDKQSEVHPGDIVALDKLREEWNFVRRQYHNKGYMKAEVQVIPNFDKANATVSYAITATSGPVYSMGVLKIPNASDDLRAAVTKAWPVPAGAPFNEGAIIGMTATYGVNPALERFFATVTMRYNIVLHDDNHTIDLTLRFERKN